MFGGERLLHLLHLRSQQGRRLHLLLQHGLYIPVVYTVNQNFTCELLIQIHVANGVCIPGLYTVNLRVTYSITASKCST